MWGVRAGTSIRARRRRGCRISTYRFAEDLVGGQGDTYGSERRMQYAVTMRGTYHTPMARVKPTMLINTHLNHRTRPMRDHAL